MNTNYPTVLEVVHKLNIEIWDKRYKDQYGNLTIDIPLIDLANYKVKSVELNFPIEEAMFTIIVNK